MTPPEARIWARLRQRNNGGVVFRRQYPVGPYILDFYCAQAKLAIEVDGLVHDRDEQAQRDEIRDAWLAAEGIETLRIPASEIMADADEIAYGVWLKAVDMAKSK